MKVISRRLKHGLKWLLSPLTLRIRSGPLQGYRWSAATGTRFVSGTYEPCETWAYTDTLRPGNVVLDVGAHVGYYTALASRLVGPRRRVIAFEPRPCSHGHSGDAEILASPSADVADADRS